MRFRYIFHINVLRWQKEAELPKFGMITILDTKTTQGNSVHSVSHLHALLSIWDITDFETVYDTHPTNELFWHHCRDHSYFYIWKSVWTKYWWNNFMLASKTQSRSSVTDRVTGPALLQVWADLSQPSVSGALLQELHSRKTAYRRSSVLWDIQPCKDIHIEVYAINSTSIIVLHVSSQ